MMYPSLKNGATALDGDTTELLFERVALKRAIRLAGFEPVKPMPFDNGATYTGELVEQLERIEILTEGQE